MRVIYSIFIGLYPLLARILSPWNAKARKWVAGRRGLFEGLEKGLAAGSGPVIWMHCASLGEFEQGRPLLERFRKEHPRHRILLTFFSPSGYEVRKNYEGADMVCYLPMDSPSNAREFLDLVHPELAVFVKYEFWHHYLDELRRRQVPTLLLSAIFRKSQPFFRPYGGFWRNMLRAYTHLFLQDQASLDLLQGIGFGDRASISGDTRFDRVSEIARTGYEVPGLKQFCGSYDVLVAGSTWEEDEDVLVHFVNQRTDLRTIIAPHEPGPSEIADIRRKFRDTLLYSEWKAGGSMEGARVLILDGMGMLANAYRHATVTYVGGGFGDDGVHNVLEAAVYYKPVVIGPVYDKFREAVELVDLGGAIVVDSAVKLEREMTLGLSNAMDLHGIGTIAGEYVRKRTGATETVMRYIQENRLLTN